MRERERGRTVYARANSKLKLMATGKIITSHVGRAASYILAECHYYDAQWMKCARDRKSEGERERERENEVAVVVVALGVNGRIMQIIHAVQRSVFARKLCEGTTTTAAAAAATIYYRGEDRLSAL